MSTPGVHFDGDFTRIKQVGPLVPSIDNLTRARLWKQTVTVRAGYWRPLPRGTRGPKGGFYVDETEPRVAGADVIEWDRIFAEVPDVRTEPEPYVYPYQIIQSGESVSLVELPIPVTSFVTYSYFHTAVPSRIQLKKAFKAAQLASVIYYLGDLPPPNAKQILAEDEQLVRWRGDIWERRSRMVPLSALRTADE